MPLLWLLTALVVQAAPPAAAYVPERVYDVRKGVFADFEVMVADLAGADVVFVGEQHDDPNTHRLELALLEGLRRRGVRPVVSFEMFERDVQPVLAKYLAGDVTEEQMLRDARPWPRYATDYRPLLELARSEGWTVVAANVPRRLASEVATSGWEALERLSPDDRALAARDLHCPQDAYFTRFAEAMRDHDAPKEKVSEGAAAARAERYYWSQCVKDETMAESIASAARARPQGAGPLVHVNGAFHSDFGQGTAERTRRRLPGLRVALVTILPAADLDAVAPAADDLRRADYLVYTVR